MTGTVWLLLFSATCGAESIKNLSTSKVTTDVPLTEQEQFNRELLRKITQLELQQRKDREDILRLENENEKLKDIIAVDRVTSDNRGKGQEIGTTTPHGNVKRGFTTAPPLRPLKASFTARLAGYEHHNLGNYANINFEETVTNVGDCYSNTTGEFTAPKDGIYFFMASIMNCGNGYMEANIIRNGIVMVDLQVDDHTGHEMATAGVITVVNRGETVAVRHNMNKGESDHSVDASSTSMGTTVFTVSASDNDSTTLTYTMTSYPLIPDLFQIDTVSGEVKATKDLIFAEDSAYLLTVTVWDTVSTTSENLRILLSNINTAPTIDNLPTVVYKDEDINGNSQIYTIDTNDPDTADTVTLTFTVWPAAYSSKFYLYKDKHLRTQPGEKLDYEDQNYFEVEFTVTDGKATTGPYTLTLYLNDVFEACSFSALTYYVTMYEGDAGVITADPGFIITDDDVGDSYTLSIDYTASTDSTYFSINAASGIITFSTNYDVDNTHPTGVSLTIICTDLAYKEGTSTVSVTVLDANDNAPQFGQAGYISYIDQYDDPTTTEKNMNMLCSDADTGINAEIEYSWTELTTGSSSYFHMSANGKVILLTYPAIYMTSGDIHSFLITGTDKGTPPLSDTTRLDIVYMETNVSATSTIPTTLAQTSNSTETAETADDSFWDEPVNVIVVVLAAIVGVLLLGIFLYLFKKMCQALKHISSSHTTKTPPFKRAQRKIEPKPTQTKKPFTFWGEDQEIGGVTYKHDALPAPSS